MATERSWLSRVTRLLALDPLRELWRPRPTQMGSLDFLRSAAVVMVMLFHLREVYLANGGEPSLLTRLPFIRYGIFGVDLFFVLSGYLIGRQLWRELAGTQSIHLGRFLLRRGLRIWPLYFAFIALMMAVNVPSYYRHADAAWWSDVLFISNYTNRGLVDGSWSLCTEDQFYLLLPLLLLITWQFAARRNGAFWLTALLLVLPCVRVAEWLWLAGNLEPNVDLFVRYMSFPIHVRCDGLVAGVLIAYLESFGGSIAQAKRTWASPWMIGLALVLGGFACWWHKWLFCYAAASWIFGATTAFLVARPGFLATVFRCRLFFWLSRLSFGMYLNHMYLFQPIARWTIATIPWVKDQPLAHFGVASLILIVVSAGIAAVTYCLIEYPCLAWREAWLKQLDVAREPLPRARESAAA